MKELTKLIEIPDPLKDHWATLVLVVLFMGLTLYEKFVKAKRDTLTSIRESETFSFERRKHRDAAKAGMRKLIEELHDDLDRVMEELVKIRTNERSLEIQVKDLKRQREECEAARRKDRIEFEAKLEEQRTMFQAMYDEQEKRIERANRQWQLQQGVIEGLQADVQRLGRELPQRNTPTGGE